MTQTEEVNTPDSYAAGTVYTTYLDKAHAELVRTLKVQQKYQKELEVLHELDPEFNLQEAVQTFKALDEEC